MSIIKKILAVLLLAGIIAFICFASCKPKDPYRWKAYEQEELLSLFQSRRAEFDEIAQIIITNENFWNKARRHEDDMHPFISSPNDKDKIKLFTESQQETLKSFLNETRSYHITLNYNESVKFTYINEDKSDAYVLSYYFGDKTAVDYYGHNAYESWISLMKSRYSTFIDLYGDWFFYGNHKKQWNS